MTRTISPNIQDGELHYGDDTVEGARLYSYSRQSQPCCMTSIFFQRTWQWMLTSLKHRRGQSFQTTINGLKCCICRRLLKACKTPCTKGSIDVVVDDWRRRWIWLAICRISLFRRSGRGFHVVSIILSVCPTIAEGNNHAQCIDLRIRCKGMTCLLVGLIQHTDKGPLSTFLHCSLYLHKQDNALYMGCRNKESMVGGPYTNLKDNLNEVGNSGRTFLSPWLYKAWRAQFGRSFR